MTELWVVKRYRFLLENLHFAVKADSKALTKFTDIYRIKDQTALLVA